MHFPPVTKSDAHRIFELKMLFLGLCVLLGLMLVIRFSSPSRRMNAEGIYSPGPMYGIQRYPRPISDFLRSSNASTRPAQASSRSAQGESQRSERTRSSASRAPADRVVRRTERSEQARSASQRSSSRNRFAPGWFWR